MAFIYKIQDFSFHSTITGSGKKVDLQPVCLISLYLSILQ